MVLQSFLHEADRLCPPVKDSLTPEYQMNINRMKKWVNCVSAQRRGVAGMFQMFLKTDKSLKEMNTPLLSTKKQLK